MTYKEETASLTDNPIIQYQSPNNEISLHTPLVENDIAKEYYEKKNDLNYFHKHKKTHQTKCLRLIRINHNATGVVHHHIVISRNVLKSYYISGEPMSFA